MTHPLKKLFSKNLYNRGTNFSINKALNSSYLDYLCCSSIKSFFVALTILETTNFRPSGNDMLYMLVLNKTENMIKKCKYIERSVYRALQNVEIN